MSNSPHAASAATARQRLAGVLGTLQQDTQIPAPVLEVLSGLARAIGPLFQLERGSADLQLFVQARTVLQETLEKMQTVDQSYPGISDATAAIAQSLGTIFTAMREAGMIPTAQGAAPAAPAPSAPAPAVSPAPAPQPVAAPVVPVAPQPAPAVMMPQPQPQPYAPQPAAAPAPNPFARPAGPGAPMQMQPAPAAQPAAQPAGNTRPASPMAMQMQPGTGPHRPPSVSAMKSASAAVPIGPNGVPRFESEIGVHTETNFFTDFLGDVRNHGGIFLATFHDLPLESQCEVFLTFPGNLTAEIRGTVRWKREASPSGSMSSSPGLGIEITYADAKAWDLIDRFIRKREPIMHES